MNDEIRALATRLDLPAEAHAYAWVCACGCFTIVQATLADYDASAGQVLAAEHPLDEERAAATAAFLREPDRSAIAERVNERRRRRLARELAQRLEQQVMANNGAT